MTGVPWLGNRHLPSRAVDIARLETALTTRNRSCSVRIGRKQRRYRSNDEASTRDGTYLETQDGSHNRRLFGVPVPVPQLATATMQRRLLRFFVARNRIVVLVGFPTRDFVVVFVQPMTWAAGTGPDLRPVSTRWVADWVE